MTNCEKKRWAAHVVRAVAVLVVVSVLGVACHQAAHRAGHEAALDARMVANHTPVPELVPGQLDSFEELARHDPLEALRTALERCERTAKEYACTFVKQERVNGHLLEEQDIRVKCRAEPYAVFMEWLRNPDKCERALYVKGKWRNAAGEERAWADPAMPLLEILLGKKGGVLQEIHGRMAQSAARRSIDQFGFASTLRLILKYCELAKERNELDLAYLGRGELNGRRTYLFRRRLPYTGENGEYPERLLLAHLDQEWLLPLGVFTWADDEKSELLGSYLFKDIDLNPGFGPEVFSKEANEF